MSVTMIIVIAPLVLLVLFVLLRSGSGKTKTGSARVVAGLVHIVPGPDGICCDAVKNLRENRFKAANAPVLPLPTCTMPLKCKCKMLPLSERRVGGDRRSGVDKREVIRFEDEVPRRKDRGRRPGDQDVFQDEKK